MNDIFWKIVSVSCVICSVFHRKNGILLYVFILLCVVSFVKPCIVLKRKLIKESYRGAGAGIHYTCDWDQINFKFLLVFVPFRSLIIMNRNLFEKQLAWGDGNYNTIM